MAKIDVVFSGGGTKGIAFAGALSVLEEQNHTPNRLLGTSAGALAATLVAAGYTSKDLIALCQSEQKPFFRDFLSPPSAVETLRSMKRPDSETRKLLGIGTGKALEAAIAYLGKKNPGLKLVLGAAVAVAKQDIADVAFEALLDNLPRDGGALPPLFSFIEHGGFFSGDTFEAWLVARIRGKITNFSPTWTLAAFQKRTGADLSIVTADTSALEVRILNHRTAPDCPVAKAVRMSMSIPLVFQEIIWQAGWGRYLGKDLTGHSLVDGAAMLTFPIRYMARRNDPVVRRIMAIPKEPAPLLGLLLDDTLPVAGDVPPPPRPRLQMVARIERLVDTVTRWEDEVVQQYEKVVCRIPCKGYGGLEFALDQKRIQVLINSGRCAAITHFKSRKWE